MKSFKLLLSAVVLVAALATPLVRAADDAAPGGAHRRQHTPAAAAEARVNRIDHAVGGLTTDQKAKLQAIFATNAEKLRTAEPADRRSIMQSEREAIRGVLTADQQAKFEALQSNGGGKAKAKAKGKGKKRNRDQQ